MQFTSHFCLRNFMGLLALTLTMVILSGCAKKPPACSAPETIGLIKEITVSNAQKITLIAPGEPVLLWGDPQGIAQAFFQAIQVEVANVVLDKYDADAKRNACRGDLKITTGEGTELSRAISYTVQLTEDQRNNNFVVAIEAFKPLTDAVAHDLATYFRAKRFVGEWSGTYSCDGVDNDTEGPRGPFSMPVTAVVGPDMRPKLERTTVGGGVESLKGLIADDRVWLRGSGRNSPDDTWTTEFSGKIEGMSYAAQGFIKAPNGMILRTCKLALALPDVGRR